jgi:photosystem II stability/assembly factor-like uncharacterized protein
VELNRVESAPMRRSLTAFLCQTRWPMKARADMKLVRILALAAGTLAVAVAVASPALDAVNRPALAARHAEQSVLLGAAKAGARLVAVGERGIIVLSDDAGKTWRQAQAPVAVTLTAVRFADPKHGFAVGHSGVVLATDDGGQSWRRRLDGVQAARIVLQQAQTSGDASALREAQRLVADGADKPFLDLYVFDAQRVLAVGAYNLAFYTDDGGANWHSWMSKLDNPKALNLYAVRVRGNTLLLAGEQGMVLRSDDAGATFRRIATPYNGSFFTAELASTQDMLLAGMRGNVWRSGDGGVNWMQLAAPQGSSITGSTLRGDGEVLLTTQGGDLMSLSLSGPSNSLTSTRTGLPPLNAVLAVDASEVLLLSVQGVTTLKTGSVK